MDREKFWKNRRRENEETLKRCLEDIKELRWKAHQGTAADARTMREVANTLEEEAIARYEREEATWNRAEEELDKQRWPRVTMAMLYLSTGIGKAIILLIEWPIALFLNLFLFLERKVHEKGSKPP